MEVVIYEDSRGYSPYLFWLQNCNEKIIQTRISARIERVKAGNFGDHKFISEGVWELRFHFSSGLRIYFLKHDGKIILLLNGGNKASQNRDIGNAILYSNDFLRKLL